MEWRLTSHDSAGVRADLEFWRRRRRAMRPSEEQIVGVLLEALLAVAIADTAFAESHLDRSLGALSAASTGLIDQPDNVASLVRAMALRAELAARRGDRATARRWAGPVVALWSGGDPAFAAVVARMRQLI
jgi:hypothetical protein